MMSKYNLNGDPNTISDKMVKIISIYINKSLFFMNVNVPTSSHEKNIKLLNIIGQIGIGGFQEEESVTYKPQEKDLSILELKTYDRSIISLLL